MSARFPALIPHDPARALFATSESSRPRLALGRAPVTVHHVGSTAVPAPREGIGYRWRGERGGPGRRYCVFDDPVTGQRMVQAQFVPTGSPETDRRLAFRDALRVRRDLARNCEAEKARRQAPHLEDADAHAACKRPWIDAAKAEALASPTEEAEPPA